MSSAHANIGAIQNNEKLFSHFEKKLAKSKTFVEYATKFAPWLDSPRAYYPEARPKILKIIEIAWTTLQKEMALQPGQPHRFNPFYQQLIDTLVKHQGAFIEESLQEKIEQLKLSFAPFRTTGPDAHQPFSPSSPLQMDTMSPQSSSLAAALAPSPSAPPLTSALIDPRQSSPVQPINLPSTPSVVSSNSEFLPTSITVHNAASSSLPAGGSSQPAPAPKKLNLKKRKRKAALDFDSMLAVDMQERTAKMRAVSALEQPHEAPVQQGTISQSASSSAVALPLAVAPQDVPTSSVLSHPHPDTFSTTSSRNPQQTNVHTPVSHEQSMQMPVDVPASGAILTAVSVPPDGSLSSHALSVSTASPPPAGVDPVTPSRNIASSPDVRTAADTTALSISEEPPIHIDKNTRPIASNQSALHLGLDRVDGPILPSSTIPEHTIVENSQIRPSENTNDSDAPAQRFLSPALSLSGATGAVTGDNAVSDEAITSHSPTGSAGPSEVLLVSPSNVGPAQDPEPIIPEDLPSDAMDVVKEGVVPTPPTPHVSSAAIDPPVDDEPEPEPEPEEIPDGPTFGPETLIMVVEKGKKSGPIVIEFTLAAEQVDQMRLWNDRSRSPSEDRRALCFSLGCYSNSDVLAAINSKPNETLVSVLNGTRPVWPNGGDLRLIGSFNDKPMEYPLAPPFAPTPDNLVDMSKFLNIGPNRIQIEQRLDMSTYMFVLVRHRPTPAQLRDMAEWRKGQQKWKAKLAYLVRPFDIKYEPF
ncbi:hypothetical protein HGRIS_013416 [Hohenbuehelia grisea]|uniref:Uncharacterized protein n=1 Tax=Hohenbuehelia grisea TaxID=104357 RepID=A0ABR3IVJ7_9AGAR